MEPDSTDYRGDRLVSWSPPVLIGSSAHNLARRPHEMGATSVIKSNTLGVPGGSLYYEARGSGPVLLLMPGGPADATTFRKVEDALAQRYTVVTYDPRGLSHSSPFDPTDDSR